MKAETPAPHKLAVKLKEAAEMLSVSTKSLRRRINSGDLKVSRAFRHIVIPISEIERFLRA